ncbi:hypothetical protein BS17DRAFT_535190 [Gyrodon lividus]|nr:hypothetical protein BS17DRAFT_535190 [Gyrodon lividus]
MCIFKLVCRSTTLLVTQTSQGSPQQNNVCFSLNAHSRIYSFLWRIDVSTLVLIHHICAVLVRMNCILKSQNPIWVGIDYIGRNIHSPTARVIGSRYEVPKWPV